MKKATFSAAILALLLLTGLFSQIPASRALDNSAAPAFTTLTNDSLKQLLDQMGYAPKPLGKGYLVVIARDEWTFNIELVLSKDASKIGMNANLGAVENPDTLAADKWKALLASNRDIDPSFFFYDADAKKLFLHRALDNRSIDAEFLRKQIDFFAGNMKSTSELWKFTK